VKGGTVAERLDLTGAQTDTHLNTPGLANLGKTVTSDTLAGSQNDLLLALNLVSLELPAGGVFDEVAVVALDELLKELGDLALAERLLCTCLGNLLLGAGGEKTGRQHGSQKELVGVVSGEDKVSLAALEFAVGVGLGRGNNDRVADNGTEAINLSTELDLDALGSLELDGGLLSVGLEGSVGGDESAGRDGGGVSDTLCDLLALVDLCDLLLEELVTLLADLDNLGALSAPSLNSCQSLVFLGLHLSHVPVTASRTFWEIWAAVLYLVRLISRSAWVVHSEVEVGPHVSGLLRL
jgi:hypothetical protein